MTDLKQTRTDLIALRKKHGANSPIGRRCSNILEMLEAGAKPEDIAAQVRDLAALTASLSKGDV
jgi:hypothetical protein